MDAEMRVGGCFRRTRFTVEVDIVDKLSHWKRTFFYRGRHPF